MADGHIVYVDLATFDNGKVLRGGALVVDSSTEPKEFRCTSAVRPTQLQKILWGAQLGTHVAGNLVGIPLLKALTQAYSLVVVRDKHFVDMRSELEAPVVCLSRHQNIEFGEDDQGGGDRDNSDMLSNPSGRFEPVVFSCHPDHPDDTKAAREMLAPVFKSRDLMEPFARIESALLTVHENEAKGPEGG